MSNIWKNLKPLKRSKGHPYHPSIPPPISIEFPPFSADITSIGSQDWLQRNCFFAASMRCRPCRHFKTCLASTKSGVPSQGLRLDWPSDTFSSSAFNTVWEISVGTWFWGSNLRQPSSLKIPSSLATFSESSYRGSTVIDWYRSRPIGHLIDPRKAWHRCR